MATDGVRVEGADRLAATLAAAARELGSLDAADTEAGALLARDARGRAPRRTGALARSIVARPTRQGAEVGSTLIYAGVIHNGWIRHHISPRPFLTETLAADRGRVLDIYGAATQRALDKVKGA